MSRKAAPPPLRTSRWLPIVSLPLVIVLAAAAWIFTRPGPSEPAAWSRLGTQDVHSLAFVGDDSNHLLFGQGIGAAFVRDRSLLGRAFTLEPAEYLEGAVDSDAGISSPFDDFGELFHDFNVDQSAPSRGAVVWAVLREIGADGMRERVRRHRDFAARLAEIVTADERLELLAPPTLSICCFRYRPPEMDEVAVDRLNGEIARRLRAETPYVPSTTRVAGRLAIRPCYINLRTTLSEVEGLARSVRELGDRLSVAGPPE